MTAENGNAPKVPMAPQYVEPRPYGEEVWATKGVPTQRGTELVRVEIHSPAGKFVHFLEPDTAIGVGEQIAEQGRVSKVTHHVIRGGGA